MNNTQVIRALGGHVMSAESRMQHHDAVIDPNTHQVQQAIYLATPNPTPSESDDMFRILTHFAPDNVRDEASLGACTLESHADRRRLIFATSLGRASHGAGPDRERVTLRQTGDFGSAMFELIPHIINGLTLSLLFALIALGFTLIVSVTEVINLAHGALFALGAYLAMTTIGAGWFGATEFGQ